MIQHGVRFTRHFDFSTSQNKLMSLDSFSEPLFNWPVECFKAFLLYLPGMITHE
jgi:hypothetical protein